MQEPFERYVADGESKSIGRDPHPQKHPDGVQEIESGSLLVIIWQVNHLQS